jgi:nickel/cobalt exporter
MHRLRAVWLCLFMLVASASAVQAHPLGNFTINHLAKIRANAGTLHVRYILDIAEIPSFQIMQSRGGSWNRTTLNAWALDEVAIVRDGLVLSVDGAPQTLANAQPTAMLRPGAGGLPILRWVAEFSAPVSAGEHQVSLVDRVYADRKIGWKDIIAGSQTEPTNELRSYPSALIGTPRRINAISFTLDGSAISAIRANVDTAPVLASTASFVRPTLLSDMFSRSGQTPLFVLLTILVAFGLGALHAVEPGHGKALLAFTLVGSRATAKQAFILALSLTLAHTIGVFLLGAVLFFASGFISESVYPAITLVSGVVIAFIGARSLARYVASRRAHSHGDDHDHSHHGAHEHSHAVPGTAPLNFGSAIWAAMSGGVAPCPAAIVVLLAALRLHHLGYGMLLIVVFSMGLAAVLTGLGLAVVHGAAWLSRRSGYARISAAGPLVTACLISTIGAVMLAQGLHQEGVGASVPLLALLTLAAISGFALSRHGHHHPHAHVHEGAPA